MPPRKSIDDKLDDLEAAASEADRSAAAAGIGAHLRDKHARVVARAAKLAADGLFYELAPELIAAYPRFLPDAAKKDPNCLAKKALVRALVNLDCDDATFFAEALAYRQPQPVWGGSVDSAAELRSAAAMGLVGTGHPRALVALTELLHDPEAEARIGAARAIACGSPREAEALLRGRVLAGDPEPVVIGECFSGLLTVEPDESVPFVARYLGAEDSAVREMAALALGESRLASAVACLRAAWQDLLPPPGFRRVLIRAAALNRTEAAADWLQSLVAGGDDEVAADVLEEVAVYHRSGSLHERLRAAAGRVRPEEP